MKIIFLDIDGCLTSKREGSYFCSDPSMYHPSKSAMAKVMKLCDDVGAKIVMSSNWRKFDAGGSWKTSSGVYQNPLPEVLEFFGDYCVGTLPKTRHINKSQALISYFYEHAEVSGFVVFDDDVNEQFQETLDYMISDHFILVDAANGITDDDISKAKCILSEEM